MPYRTPTRTELLDLLKRLQGTGYASAAGTARAVELEAVAEIASKASEPLATASDNAFPGGLDDLASDYEWAHQLPSDDSLTTEDRRARASAFTRTMPHCTSARATDALVDLTGGGSLDVASRSSPNNRPDRGPRAFWQGASSDAARIEAARLILERAQPAACIPAGAGQRRMSYATTFTSSGDSAVVNAGSDMPTVIGVKPPDTSAIQVTQGETVTMDLLAEIRRSVFWAPSSGAALATFRVKNTDATTTYRLGQWMIALGSIAAGATATLDSGDWSNTFADAYGLWTATNITAGGDPSLLLDSERVYRSARKTVSGAFPMLDYVNAASSATVAATSSGFTLQNTSGATRYFCLFVRSTAKWATADDSHTAFEAVAHKTTLPSNDVLWMSRNTSIIDANAATSWTRTLTSGGTQRGAFRRVVYTGPTAYVGSSSEGVPTTVVVDTSIDWRGRWLLVYGVVKGSGTAIVTGNWDGFEPTTNASEMGIPRVFFTGNAGGSATTYFTNLGDGTQLVYKMYADATTGALTVQHASPGLGAHTMACGVWFVAAAPKSSDAASSAPLDTTYVAPIDLAEPQYQGTWQQGWLSEPRLSPDDPAQIVPTAPPLGLISDGGCPPVPLQWTQRERVGEAADPSCIVRQRIFGQRKRMLSLAVSNGATLRIETANGETGEPVDEIDYRDRLVWVSGVVSTTDATIAGGGSDAIGTPFVACFYTGPFGTQTVTITTGVTLTHSFAKSASGRGVHGVLSVVNASGGARYINASLECTGQLGLSDCRTTGT